jgi:hypothetical protein
MHGKVSTRSRRTFLTAVAAVTLVPLLAGAQVKPTVLPPGQLRIIVPYSPGGGTDILARAIAQQLGDLLHRSVIVDNRVGANGTIGAALVAKSPPDGLTMLLVPAGYAANPALYQSLPYDQAKDLAPVTILASGPLVLVVHPSLPVKSVKELIALAKSQPGLLNVGNAGIGSLPHLSAELFNVSASVKLVSVPYKGAGPALVDVLGGRVQVYFMNILQCLPIIKEGKVARPRSHESAAVADRTRHSADRRRGARLRHDQLVRHAGAGGHPKRNRARVARRAFNRAHAAGHQAEDVQRRHDCRRQHARAIHRLSGAGDGEVQPRHRIRRHQELAMTRRRHLYRNRINNARPS